ncbi:hypothetical protein BHU61_07030 [Macrococcus epidermidis]|uniref:Uncharacterized protein n=3 Tax=Staphylococcaceae TaxID=90964 RepID=A0A2G5NLX4_9STAP|nr:MULTISPECIES: hypothetical protein [Macrococcus]RAI80138.1 hypothetical protein BFS35_010155 [Macrococcus goetzii]RAK45058.1 hypothetical protein BHU61_07030 [Macrococcus epidermidis]UBH15067.1 hypothetical protein LAU44_10055 [Macrococcus armenti]UBH17428.1 hypothetical protein LAU39_10085 [Macrococcus armenti]UBH19692.1 hypothetical protein LAU40_10060 [Macrococcus armenti]
MSKGYKYFLTLAIILAILNIIFILIDYEWRGVFSWASFSLIILCAFILMVRKFMKNEDHLGS